MQTGDNLRKSFQFVEKRAARYLCFLANMYPYTLNSKSMAEYLLLMITETICFCI